MNKSLIATIIFIFTMINVSAQINHIDYIPDKVLINTTDTIDINGDGIMDLIFTQENNIPGDSANGVGVTLLHYDIEFVGNPPPYDPSHFYTYKLDSNILVDNNADNKSWIVKLGPNDAVRVMYIYFYVPDFHLGEWTNGVIDGFLGIRIKINNQWHYGWIRMDVTLYAQQLTIKDYAYNLTPEQGIYTNQASSYKHQSLIVTYDNSLCANKIVYKRNPFSKLAYDKVYKVNINGQYENIGVVSASDPAVFIHNDSSILFGTQSYSIAPVDSSTIEWAKSNTANSVYAKIEQGINNITTLSWTALNHSNFSQYIIYKRDSLCNNFIILDSVSNNTHSYNIIINDSMCNEYQIMIALDSSVLIPGYGIIDTIKSNIASPIISNLITPSAGFYSTTISTGFYEKIQFHDTSKANIDSWYWDFGDGGFSSLANPIHDFLPGTYTISLKVSNCFGQDSIIRYNYIDVIDGINSADNQFSIQLYPNPANDQIIIDAKTNYKENISRIRLYSIDSKLLYNSELINHKSYNLDLKTYKSGMYMVEITLSNGIKTIKKLIISKD